MSVVETIVVILRVERFPNTVDILQLLNVVKLERRWELGIGHVKLAVAIEVIRTLNRVVVKVVEDREFSG